MTQLGISRPPLTDAAFSKFLLERFGLKISRQAINKAAYIPRNPAGLVIVEDALLRLAERGRISLDPDGPAQGPRLFEDGDESEDGEDSADAASDNGRPRAKGSALYEAQALTEGLRQRKLLLDLEEREGRSVDIDMVTDAMTSSSRRIGSRIDRLVMLADELSSAARAGGAPAIREILRRETRALRAGLAEDLRLSADEDAEDDAAAAPDQQQAAGS